MIPGIAKFDPSEGACLELIGSLNEGISLLLNRRNSQAELIHGIDSSNNKISLVFCSVIRHEKNYKSKFSLTKYKVQYLLVGFHLNDVNEKVFSRGNFFTDKLNRWFLRNNINNSYSFNSKNEITGFSISYDSEKDRFIKLLTIDDFWSVEIQSKSWQQEKDFEGINIHEIYLIKVFGRQPSGFLEIVEKCERLNLFFELAFASKVKIESFYLFNSQMVEDKNGNDSIALYYKQRSGLRKKSTYERPIFNYNLIEDHFGNIILKWMKIDSKLEPILNFLVKSFQNDDYFDPSNFMIIVNALEGFHRRFRENKEIELKARIDLLLEEFSNIDDISRLELNSFKIARNRHYYSHFFEKDFQHLYKIEDLIGVTFDLRKLLFCCILRQIGFTDDLLNKIPLESL